MSFCAFFNTIMPHIIHRVTKNMFLIRSFSFVEVISARAPGSIWFSSISIVMIYSENILLCLYVRFSHSITINLSNILAWAMIINSVVYLTDRRFVLSGSDCLMWSIFNSVKNFFVIMFSLTFARLLGTKKGHTSWRFWFLSPVSISYSLRLISREIYGLIRER